jgi:hypothetical protein
MVLGEPCIDPLTLRRASPVHKYICLSFCRCHTSHDRTVNRADGRAVSQAVSLWLPTAAARVRVWVACGVCGGQSGTGAGFLRVFRFPLPIIPQISPSSSSPGAGTISLLVAVVPS